MNGKVIHCPFIVLGAAIRAFAALFIVFGLRLTRIPVKQLGLIIGDNMMMRIVIGYHHMLFLRHAYQLVEEARKVIIVRFLVKLGLNLRVVDHLGDGVVAARITEVLLFLDDLIDVALAGPFPDFEPIRIVLYSTNAEQV